MPNIYTHQILAEKVKELLPERILPYVAKDKQYYFGAQGGDVFYLYKMGEGQKNLGKYLHRKNVYTVFCRFFDAAKEGDEYVTSYIAGYITHYAGDIVFHPYVYSLLHRLEYEETDNWKGNRHALIESDLDGYFVQKFKGISPLEYKYPLTFSDISYEKLCRLMENSTEERTKRNVHLRAFRSAIKRYFRYNRWVYDRTGRKNKFVYGVEKILKIPHALSPMIHRADYDARFLNLEHMAWRDPEDDSLVFTDGADELFSRAVSESVRLITRFFDCVEKNELPDSADFSKHFLTGQPLEN